MKRFIPLIFAILIFGVATYLYYEHLVFIFTESSKDFLTDYILFNIASLILVITIFIYIS